MQDLASAISEVRGGGTFFSVRTEKGASNQSARFVLRRILLRMKEEEGGRLSEIEVSAATFRKYRGPFA